MSDCFDLQQLLAIPLQCWLQLWCRSLLHRDRCRVNINDELMHILNQTLCVALIRLPHCYQLKLFLLTCPSFWFCIYPVAKPPVKETIIVLKNISTCQSSPVAVAKLVWKGEKLLEIVREIFWKRVEKYIAVVAPIHLDFDFYIVWIYSVLCLLFSYLLESILLEFG